MLRAPSPTPVLLIISGPAGSGKTTLCERLIAEFPDRIQRVVTSTNRPPRPGEVDGADYHFLSSAEFEKGIRQGDFMEWAMVHGRYYGSQKAHILDLLAGGKDLLLNIDVQGTQSFRKEAAANKLLAGRLHTVFIEPQSMDQIRDRLRGRGSDNPSEIQRRLQSAKRELASAGKFDHRMISGTREEDYQQLRQIYLSLRK